MKPMATTISLVQKGHSSTPEDTHTATVSEAAGGVRRYGGAAGRAVLTIGRIVLQKRNSP